MVKRELLKDLLSAGSQRDQHFPPVFACPVTPDVSYGRQAIHKFNRTVMSNLESLR
jgi:hypothetical protein